MSRIILLLLLSCPLWGQTLLTLSVMDPRECKPIGGPGCSETVPVTCDLTNQGPEPEPVLLTKAQCRTLMAAEGLVAIDDAQAAAIWRQRAKDETWGKIARYATFLPIRVALVGLATWQGGASWGLTTAGAYEMLDQGAERAAMRAPEITRNLEAATVDNVSVGVGETGTVTAWASAAQVKSLAYEQRTRYQWLAGGVPESMQPKTLARQDRVVHKGFLAATEKTVKTPSHRTKSVRAIAGTWVISLCSRCGPGGGGRDAPRFTRSARFTELSAYRRDGPYGG